MIISHRHRFIFIKNRKTASTSIEVALSGICGEEDVIIPLDQEDEKYRQSLGYRGSQNHAIPIQYYRWSDFIKLLKYRTRVTYYNHMNAKQIRDRVPSSVWDSYFKFCFERNPFDKIISWFYWRQDYLKKRFSSVADLIRSGDAHMLSGFPMYSIDGRVAVDKIYKYEEMDSALNDLTERFSLQKPLLLPNKRLKGQLREDRRHYSEVLNSEDIELVKAKFSREFDIMGYELSE